MKSSSNKYKIVKDAFDKASLYYEKSNKPLNYVCRRIRKQLEIKTTDQEIFNILYDVKYCPTCGLDANFAKGYNISCGNCSLPSKLKGLTYSEIHPNGTTCGYQKGDKNIAKKENIKIKISVGVEKSYTSELRKFRSLNMSMNNVLSGYVYILYSKSKNIIKVGFSQNVEKRFYRIKSSTKLDDLKILYKIKDKNALNIERDIHLKFLESNIVCDFGTEWYPFEIYEDIKSHCRVEA